jgi:hypothetical protein
MKEQIMFIYTFEHLGVSDFRFSVSDDQIDNKLQTRNVKDN